MTEIAQKRPLTIKKKYVYWLVQLLFVIALVGFMYSYLTNRNIFNDIPRVAGNPTGEPSFVRFIYGKFGGGEFEKPMAVTVIDNQIYVSDTNKKRIQVFDYDGNPVKTFGTGGTGAGQLQFPYGLAGDSKGVLYVADLYNGSVSKFTKDGKFLGLFAEKKASDSTLTAPAGMVIKNDKVYITDVKLHVVKVFDLNGKLISQMGKNGKGIGEFNAPNAVALDSEDNIYITDTGNQRVQVFDKNGKFLKVINGSSDGKGQSVFVNPRGVGVNDQGNVYVISNLTHRFYGFDKEGKQAFALGGFGEGEKEFALPNGLFIDERGRVYVTDTLNQRIAVFQS